MNRFQYQKQSHKPSGFLISICVFLLVIVLFISGISSVSENTRKRQKEALSNALTRSITYCYTVEGTYPESLDYLKDNYGLVYDEKFFFVDYHVTGSNIFPDVTIIEGEE